MDHSEHSARLGEWYLLELLVLNEFDDAYKPNRGYVATLYMSNRWFYIGKTVVAALNVNRDFRGRKSSGS